MIRSRPGSAATLSLTISRRRAWSAGLARTAENTELGHAAVEGIGLDSQELRRASRPAYPPADAFEDRLDLLRLEIVEPHAAFRRNGSGGRQVNDQARSLRDDDRPLDHVPQLAHVARPRVTLKGGKALLRDRLDRLSKRLRVFLYESPDQR